MAESARKHEPPMRIAMGAPARLILIVLGTITLSLGAIGVTTIVFFPESAMLGKVVETLLSLGGTSLVLMGCALAYARRMLPRAYLWVVAAVCLFNVYASIRGVWFLPSWLRLESLAATGILLASGAAVSPHVFLLSSRRWPVMAWTAIGCTTGAAAICLAEVWSAAPGGIPDWMWPRVVAPLWIIAATLLHTALIGAVRKESAPAWLRWLTMGSGLALGGMLALWMALTGGDAFEDEVLRLGAALGIASVCLTIVTALCAIVLRRGRVNEADGSVELEVRCPGCLTMQTLRSGESACAECGCAFSIQVTPSKCLGCGYSLKGLKERKCPECGVGF